MMKIMGAAAHHKMPMQVAKVRHKWQQASLMRFHQEILSLLNIYTGLDANDDEDGQGRVDRRVDHGHGHDVGNTIKYHTIREHYCRGRKLCREINQSQIIGENGEVRSQE